MHMMYTFTPDVRKRIVVVDDSPSTCTILANTLRTEGYVVVCLENGVEVLQMYAAPHIPAPDVMIVDMRLPKISGLELVKRLREKENLKAMRIIMLTDGSIFSHLRSRLAGADFTLCKPSPISKEMLEMLFEVIKVL